jgi:hypothetical protein
VIKSSFKQKENPMNQLRPEPTLNEIVVPANQSRFTNEQKVTRLFTAANMDSFAPSNEQVVVIVPSGSYNEPRELGRYKSFEIAARIIAALDLTEFRLFSLDSGEELYFRVEDILH